MPNDDFSIPEAPNPESKGPQITLTARQLALRDFLEKRSEGLGSIYHGILYALSAGPNPENVIQAAHSARELIRRLPNAFPGMPESQSKANAYNKLIDLSSLYRTNPTDRELRDKVAELDKYIRLLESSRRQRLENLITQANPGGMAIEEVKKKAAKQLLDYQDWLSSIAHHGRPGVTQEEFRTKLEAFEQVLNILIADYFDISRELITLMVTPDPSDADLEKLYQLFLRSATMEQFFQDLTNPKWLPLLRKANYFGRPKDIIIHENGAISCPPWPQSVYLFRCVEAAAEEVADILMEVGETENARIHQELVEIATKLPAHLVTAFAGRAASWISDRYHTITLLPFKLAELAVKLVNEGESQVAFGVADNILDVRINEDRRENQMEIFGRNIPPEAEAFVDDWHYGEMIKICSALGNANPRSFLTLMCDKLAKAIFIEHEVCGRGNLKTDLSYISRPAIEENEQNHGTDRLKDSLIDCIRDFAIARLRQGEAMKEVLHILRAHEYPIFQRIELHLLKEFAESNVEEISSWFSKIEYFSNSTIHHEFYLLLENAFGMVSGAVQKIYLDWISSGPDVEHYKEVFKNETGREPSDEQLGYHTSYWKVRRYAPIVSFLNPEHAAIYNGLLSTVQPDDHPEFNTYSTSWVGPTSPLDSVQLGSMSLDQVMEYLAGWDPPRGHFSPTPEGLGRFLKDDVRKRANEYSDIADTIKPAVIRPVYLFHLFSGFEGAVQDKRELTWPKVLYLADLIACDDDLPEPDNIADPLETGWTGVRKEIARLLSTATREPKMIPFDLRALVWKIIDKLTHEKEPTLEYEAEYGGSNLCAVDLSVNTARGEAVHAVFNYIFWVNQAVNEGISDKERKYSLPPETLPILSRLLDVAQEPTSTIRSVIGWYLWYMAVYDLDWTRGHLDVIIPKQAEQSTLRTAAFEGFFSFNNPNGYIFRNLRDFYVEAFDWANRADTDPHLHKPGNNYVDHLLVYYWWGLDPLEKDECLIAQVFELGNIKLRAHAIEHVGRSLESLLPVMPNGPEVLIRLQQLLDWRLSRISQMENSSVEIVDEMKEFGWWFANAQMDKKWLIDKLTQVLALTHGKIEWAHKVIERLKDFVPVDPVQVARAFDAILTEDPTPWNMDYWYPHLLAVFEALKNCDNCEAWGICRGTINFLGERGFRSFGYLL